LEILMSKSGLVMQTAMRTVNPWTHSYRVENSDEDNRPDEADIHIRGPRPNNGRATGGGKSYYSESERRSPSPVDLTPLVEVRENDGMIRPNLPFHLFHSLPICSYNISNMSYPIKINLQQAASQALIGLRRYEITGGGL
jgi:hypothetical protein